MQMLTQIMHNALSSDAGRVRLPIAILPLPYRCHTAAVPLPYRCRTVAAPLLHR